MNDVKRVLEIQKEIEFFQDQATVVRGEKPDPPPFKPSPKAINWDNWDGKTEPSPSQVDLMISSVTEREVQDIVKHFNLKDYGIEKTWGPGQVKYHFDGTNSVYATINSFLTDGRVSAYLEYGWPELFSGRKTAGDMKKAFGDDVKVGEETEESEREELRKIREEERLSMLEAFEKKQEQKRKLESLNARKERARRAAQYKIFQKRVDKILDMPAASARNDNLLKFRKDFYEWYTPLVRKYDKILLMEQYDPTGFDWQMELNHDIPKYKDLYSLADETEKERKLTEELEKKIEKEKQKKLTREKAELAREKHLDELNSSGTKRIKKLLDDYKDLQKRKGSLSAIQFSTISGRLSDEVKIARKNIEDSRRRWKESLEFLMDEYPDFWEIYA